MERELKGREREKRGREMEFRVDLGEGNERRNSKG